jgi:hypothetical protein
MGQRKINRGSARREELSCAAALRAEERAARTPQQQLELLDARLGDGIGAARERARLQDLIDNPPQPKKKKK